MSWAGRFLILFVFYVWAANGFIQAQKRNKKLILQAESAPELNNYSESSLFDFPNVNKIPYYHNRAKINKIAGLDQAKNWEKLYPLLRAYVMQFGIENFYHDTYLLWRLANLSEIQGNPDEAKLLFKLVLKHNREDIDIRELQEHYDLLVQNEKDYYVPLDYYYELVEFRKEVDTLRPPRGVLLNMGIEINSKLADYGPTLNVNDNILIFTSKRNFSNSGIDNIQNEDLFFSIRSDGFWSEAKAFDEVNTDYNEGSACLSKDGKSLFFTRCHSPNTYGDCDIFMASMQSDSTWGNVRNLGVNVNSRGWDSHPSLSHSDDTLFFASDRIGGFGLSDIYYTTKNKDGEWNKALNLGPIINTRNSELSPFYHHVYNVLYFSSNGHSLNFGAFDIYKIYKNGSNWDEPKNIGPLVNGPGSEFYFTIDSESKDLFYSRSVENDLENLDLYSFPLPMEAQPGAIVVYEGSLMDEDSGDPFKGIVSIIDMDNGIEVAPKFLRPDGTFKFDLINEGNYLLIIQGEEFLRIEELFQLSGDMEYHLKTPQLKSTIKFESVVFGNGEAELVPEMFSDLDKIANFLLDNQDFNLKISGHTDSDGREEFNLNLSQKRAEAIKEYIVYFGSVEPERIEAKGFGSSKPLKTENTEEDKKLNRRVEFELHKVKSSQ